MYVCLCVCMNVCRYAAIYSPMCMCVCARASRNSCGQIERTFVSPPCIKLTIKASSSWTCSTWVCLLSCGACNYLIWKL